MPITENYALPTASILDANVRQSIRQALVDFYQRVGLKYVEVKLDEALYNECCREATNRGFPMDGSYSIRPYMAIGVATFCYCYAYLPDRATKMWICLYTALHICIDDRVNRGKDTKHLYRFHERFANCKPQGDPGLQALDSLLREVHLYYPALVSSLITTSSLDFVSALLIELDTTDMQISTKAPFYPEYSRLLSGIGSAFSLFIFPATIPYQEYIQCMPDLMYVVNGVNDVLSFYKEEAAGENANYVSLVAATRGLTKLNALRGLVEKTAEAHHNILECLEPHPEAYDAYVTFFDGCVKLYAALRRYKLEEIMLEGSSSHNSRYPSVVGRPIFRVWFKNGARLQSWIFSGCFMSCLLILFLGIILCWN
ncbi:terpenoid synthase [Rhizopogon vinicolor AM-OR11-026]|uniref:Terpenoid synthase n=1 Tax=Rhizopogon vinicolor AM-OR11-026 TaxID=1314800 RepID=A0A1B7N3N9_9AGAM|nr:terpenoid synthase [Rhizopogon vinicolor AM-OR11-026]